MMILSVIVIIMAFKMIVDVVGLLLLIDLSRDGFSRWPIFRGNAAEIFVEFRASLEFDTQGSL